MMLARSLVWLIPLRDADTLDERTVQTLGRLHDYNSHAPVTDTTTLQGRILFEYVVRKLIDDQGREAQSQEFNEAWLTFCHENFVAERRLKEMALTEAYERGRHDLLRAQQMGFAQPAVAPDELPPLRPQAKSGFDPLRPAASVVSTLSGDGRDTAESIEEVRPDRPQVHPSRPSVSGMTSPYPAKRPKLISERLQEFLAEQKERKGDHRAAADIKPVIDFLIALVGDRPPDEYTREDFKRVDHALPDIPNRKGVPKEAVGSLFQRYEYAEENGWTGLQRLTQATIENRYHSGLSRFFGWLIHEGLFHGPKPKFSMVKPENLVSLPRDSFEDEELIRLFSLPLFTGCAGLNRIWEPGPYFIQNHLYWGYVSLVLTGMRPGEVGQQNIEDVIEAGGLHFFDLRPFDARKGRVALSEIRQLKTRDSARVIPCHPLLIELGLLERIAELEAIGERKLLPEWKPYTRPTGQVSWGYPITKSFQYLKKKLKIQRADLTLYGTRHEMADFLDAQGTPQRNRDRILGHVNKASSSGRYGSKRVLTPEEAEVITKLNTPLIQELRRILLGAKERAEAGELTVLKPWLQPRR